MGGLSNLGQADPFGIVGVTKNLIGDVTGANAAADAAREGAQSAADATIQSTEKNIDFQKWLWGEQKDLLSPYAAAGGEALTQYQDEIAKPFTAESMTLDPGYQFNLSQGLKGVERSASAKGMQLSGRTLKGLGRYAQDYASSEFQNAYNRRQQGIQNLYALATMGQSAAAGQASSGTTMGNQVSNSILRAGAAESQMYSDFGNINAAQAVAPWNTLMQVGQTGAMLYGAGAFSPTPKPVV